MTRRSRRLSEDVVDIERLSQSSMISLSSPRVSLSKTEPSAERKIGSEWNTARVLSCYVDTLDILQKQVNAVLFLKDFEILPSSCFFMSGSDFHLGSMDPQGSANVLRN